LSVRSTVLDHISMLKLIEQKRNLGLLTVSPTLTWGSWKQ
jgi:hypothetical protein